MMHGDLTPTNVIVNAGDEVYGDSCYFYDLFLCDFDDIVARKKDGNTIYRTETVLGSDDSTSRVTSHFFETQLPPKINPMLDLSKFIANLLLKIPFEPSIREGRLASIKLKLRNEAREYRTEDPTSMISNQLEIALDWAQKEIRDSCFLAEEGVEDSWRDLLKAMIFDQCLQIMMFWRRFRSKSAIDNDLGLDKLIKAFYNISIEPEWNKEVVKLNFSKLNIDLDPDCTTMMAWGVAEEEIPKFLRGVMKDGFPPNSLRELEGQTYEFQFTDEDFGKDGWECSFCIENEVLRVTYISEQI